VVMQDCRVNIQVLTGKSSATKMGTWRLHMEDDEWMTHVIYIPNTLFAPEVPFHLFSPQHRSQQYADSKGNIFSYTLAKLFEHGMSTSNIGRLCWKARTTVDS